MNLFEEKFKLITVTHGLGKTCGFIESGLYNMKTIPAQLMWLAIQKHWSVTQLPLYLFFSTTNLSNAIEHSAFMPINYSIIWLGAVVSPLYAFHSSHLQQKLSNCQVHALVTQVNALQWLKSNGTLIHYTCPAVPDTVDIVLLQTQVMGSLEVNYVT